ncbi:MAG: hypothetical protein QXH51_06485 [Candidatus Bathyarchaeia archaeon]
MGWATGEDRLSKLAETLLLASGVACIAASAIYLLVAVLPAYYFHGYVQGYYSILDYRLHYLVNRQPVPMPHTDYIRHVSLSFTISSLAILAISALSIAISRRRLPLASGLVFGCASTIILLYGLLNGYIYRAISLDLGRFSGLLGDRVIVRTLAGNITFVGVRLEQTGVLGLALNGRLMLALVATAVAASYASIVLVLTKSSKPLFDRIPWPARIRQGLVYAMMGILAFSSLASVFTYYPSTLTIAPQPPPATLEQPPYTYTCTALTRTSREALTYTDFEIYPIPGWTARGGIWNNIGDVAGAKGKVLQGVDNDRGLGGASQYYYNTKVSGNNWVALKTRLFSGTGYYGVSMMNSGRNRMYAVEIYATATTGYLEIWTYNVVSGAWSRHANVIIPNFNRESWYTIVVSYSVSGTSITITAYLYDASGNYITSASVTITHNNVFTPAYVGVIVNNVTAYFDEFILSTVDPRSISFTNFYTGMKVEVWDNLGNPVNSTTAPAQSFTLNVISDIVVGTGGDGRIVVRYPDAYLCGTLTMPSTDAILGGDAYALTTASIAVSLGSNRTSASLTLYISGTPQFTTTARVLRISASQVLYTRLILDSASAPPTLNLDIWLEGATSSTSITIRDGVPTTTSTSIVQLNLGLGNSVSLNGYFTATGQTATLNLKLELCTMPGGAGACVYYPVVIDAKA